MAKKLECISCKKEIHIGDLFRHTPDFQTVFCKDNDCSSHIATVPAHLEVDWFPVDYKEPEEDV
jgi:hypothetical protein